MLNFWPPETALNPQDKPHPVKMWLALHFGDTLEYKFWGCGPTKEQAIWSMARQALENIADTAHDYEPRPDNEYGDEEAFSMYTEDYNYLLGMIDNPAYLEEICKYLCNSGMWDHSVVLTFEIDSAVATMGGSEMAPIWFDSGTPTTVKVVEEAR
jgi:hypothetical protein